MFVWLFTIRPAATAMPGLRVDGWSGPLGLMKSPLTDDAVTIRISLHFTAIIAKGASPESRSHEGPGLRGGLITE